jgi:hypothetical protein
MQRPTLALVSFVALLGVAGSAKADTIDFTFVSTPNNSGTYVDASGTLTGNLTWSTNPADLNVLVLDGGISGGTITVVSNIPPSPFVPGAHFLIPELNGSSDLSSSSGVFQFSNSPGGIIVSSVGTGAAFVLGSSLGLGAGFDMPGNPAEGGPFYFNIFASGINGAPGNSAIIASDGEAYEYETDGTLTLDGQVGAYDLTPEPPSWLLLGSGVLLLGWMFYRKSAAVQSIC